MRLKQLFQKKKKDILSIYFTAGYPEKESTTEIIRALDRHGADMIEIGIPFSDPMADGPVIQKSNTAALRNGMNLKLLFTQLKAMRKETEIPVLLMGYLNPILQYGFELFCADAQKAGIDGLIIPDLLPEDFDGEYRKVMVKYDLSMVFLITPGTSEDRIRSIDRISDTFIYLVTSSITTGGNSHFKALQRDYFKFIRDMGLRNPVLAGFGVRAKEDLDFIGHYFPGAIIGSAFVRHVSRPQISIDQSVQQFIKNLRS